MLQVPQSGGYCTVLIGQVLMNRGCIDDVQLNAGLSLQQSNQEPLGQCLRELGLPAKNLAKALADQSGQDFIELGTFAIDDQAVQLVPEAIAQNYQILPIGFHDDLLRVANAEPGRAKVLDDLRLITGHDIEEVIVCAEELQGCITEAYQITVERMVSDLHGDSSNLKVSDNLHDIEVMASEPTVINLVNLIISSAVRERASDVHLTPFEGALELRYRIDGILQEMPPPPKQMHAALVSRIKIMAEMNIAERFIPQDGRIQITLSGARVDIRVGTMPTVHGESVVMRLLEKGGRIQTMVELGLDSERAKILQHAIAKPHGIFLATGPTGSGKTTSLYSILSDIYSVERKIITLEDPVEYELPGVAQIPVRPARDFTFATGLRAILRQDPDVIMLGEIRDAETAQIAVRAALTGHLVFSTLHTNDACGAVTRLVDMGIEPFLLASSLEGVLAQRLVRRLCVDCRERVPMDDLLRERLEAVGLDWPQEDIWRAQGCELCRNTGYLGRTGLYELLIFGNHLKESVLAGGSSAQIRMAAESDPKHPMTSLCADGLIKAAAGETSIEEVLRVAADTHEA